MPATRAIAVSGCRKKSVMAASGRVRVVMTISICVSAWVVSIFASVFVSYRRPSFVPMLIRALLAMLVSMFILAVLRVKAERSQAGHCECTKGK
jgi:VanZ family protein